MLEIKNLHARLADGREILKGIDLSVERRRGARDHGAERLGQEHARRGARRPRRLRGHRGQRHLSRPRPAGDAGRRAGARGRVSRVPVPGRDPGREQHVFPARRAQRAAPPSRRARARCRPVPASRARQAEAAGHRRGSAAARRQCRLFRRREEAQRDLPDGDAGAAARDPRRDRQRARHRRAARRRARRQPACARRTARSS